MKAGQEIRENRSPLRDGGHWADGQTDSWDAGCAEERKLKEGEQAKLTFSSKFRAKIPLIGQMLDLCAMSRKNKSWYVLTFTLKLNKLQEAPRLPPFELIKNLAFGPEVRS